jgi:hypothetical protein
MRNTVGPNWREEGCTIGSKESGPPKPSGVPTDAIRIEIPKLRARRLLGFVLLLPSVVTGLLVVAVAVTAVVIGPGGTLAQPRPPQTPLDVAAVVVMIVVALGFMVLSPAGLVAVYFAWYASRFFRCTEEVTVDGAFLCTRIVTGFPPAWRHREDLSRHRDPTIRVVAYPRDLDAGFRPSFAPRLKLGAGRYDFGFAPGLTQEEGSRYAAAINQLIEAGVGPTSAST